MIIDVIPIKRLPRGIGDTFSYNVAPAIESDILPGQIVEVDFRGTLRPAVVKAIRQAKHQVGLKTVGKILHPSPLVTPEQMRLAKWVANYYFTSLATASKLFVPDLPKRIIVNSSNKMESLVISRPRKSSSSKFKNNFIWWDDADDKNKIINTIIGQTLKKGKQILWLWPEKYQAITASKNSAPALQSLSIGKTENKLKAVQILLYEKSTSKKKNLEQFLKILNSRPRQTKLGRQKPKIIIGTRSALFAPFSNLGLVILEDEANSLYKSEITPRYHTREAAQELAKLYGAKLILTSPAPSLETYESFCHPEFVEGKQKSKQYFRKKTLRQAQSDTVKLIDTKEERLKENYSSLSEELQDATKIALKEEKQVFLFHNRRGQASSVTCKGCGYSILCADCQLPLTHHSGDRLVCHHCRARVDLPPFCPKCSSEELKLTGKGTQKLEQEVKKLFPKAKILRIDSDTDFTRYSLPVTGYDILIGTEFALSANRVAWANIGVIGVINADTALYRADFRASERTYQLLIKLKSKSYKLKAKYIIQTYNPKNYAIQAIAQNKPELFYKHELKLRKALGYPPFKQVIKLIYKNANEKKTVGEAMHIYNRLRKHMLKSQNSKFKIQNSELEILKPYPAFERMERGKYKFYIILRVSPDTPESLYEKIRQLVPPDWVFDRDPETLL